MNYDEYIEQLHDANAMATRRKFCVLAANNLLDSANTLFAFGLSESKRRALAIVAQMGGSVAVGVVALLEAKNLYAANALLRQLVEVEYLIWLFGTDPDEAGKWLLAS